MADLDFLETASEYSEADKDAIRASWVQEKSAHVVACPRSPLKDWRSIIPDRYLEALEQNQLINLCCRHAEEHDIEAWYSNADQVAKKEPDIYILYCNGCGRRHRRFCVGAKDTRPFWEIR